MLDLLGAGLDKCLMMLEVCSETKRTKQRVARQVWGTLPAVAPRARRSCTSREA